MKCVILAAGQGSRLRPLTNNLPKAMVKFLGLPLISYQTKLLKQSSINEIAIVTGYCASKLQKLGFKTFHNKRFETTNMVESLFVSKEFWQNDASDLIIAYGDIIYQQKNLDNLLSSHGDIVLMVDDSWIDLWSLRQTNPIYDAETLKFNPDGSIYELGKKPNSLKEIESQYTGLIKLNGKRKKEFLDFYNKLDREALYDGKSFDNLYMTQFIQLLIDNGWHVSASRVNNGWLEIDSTKDLYLYEKMYATGTLQNLWKRE